MEDVLKTIYEYVATYGLKVVGAVVVFIVGRWLAKMLAKLAGRGLTKANVDETLVRFGESFSYVALLIFVIVAVLATLGIQTTSFVAVLAAAGLAVGLALQGSLANFAAGILLILFKPYKVGDFVEIAGAKGTVKDIQIFTTILDSPDNLQVIIPNAKATGGNIINYTANGTRRVDMVVGVSYEDDLRQAGQIIEDVLASDERVLKEPAHTVAVSELGDSSVNFVVRPWVKASDYWDVRFDLTAEIKLRLDDNGITIPYPQHDIHIKSTASE